MKATLLSRVREK